MKMSDVAERFAFSPSSATILIDRMVKQQLVKRVPQEDDRRIIQIALDAEETRSTSGCRPTCPRRLTSSYRPSRTMRRTSSSAYSSDRRRVEKIEYEMNFP